MTRGIIVIIQVGLYLLWTIFNTSILQWRARKLRNLSISYKDAFVVSIKAVLVGMVVGNVVAFAFAFSGNPDLKSIDRIGFPIGLLAWWFVHSNALFELLGSSSLLSMKDARSISTSVLVHIFVLLLPLYLLVLALVPVLLSLIK